MESTGGSSVAPRPASPPDAATATGEPAARLAAADRMVRERLRFALPATAIGLGAYLLIAVLAGFTQVLGPWTLLLLVLLVPLVWVLAVVYKRRADHWDALAAALRTGATSTTRPDADASTSREATA